MFCCTKCGCGREDPRAKYKMQIIRQGWEFSLEEYKQLESWFSENSMDGRMTLNVFKDSMGFLNHGFSAYLFDRMFAVMDKDKDGIINFKDYGNYMNVLMYGSDKDKYKQSFQIIDYNCRDKVNEEEFKHHIYASCAMFSTMLNSKVDVDDSIVQAVYKCLDKTNKGYFDIEDYETALIDNPTLFDWMDITNEHIQQKLRKKPFEEEKKITQSILDIRQINFLSFINTVEDTLHKCLACLDSKNSFHEENVESSTQEFSRPRAPLKKPTARFMEDQGSPKMVSKQLLTFQELGSSKTSPKGINHQKTNPFFMEDYQSMYIPAIKVSKLL